MAGVELPFGIQINNPKALDIWRGPWVSIPEANLSVPAGVRYRGRQVDIAPIDGTPYVAWWRDGIDNTNLVPFVEENASSDVIDTDTGKIKTELLPEIDLYQYFNNEQFVVVDGKITFVGDGGVIVKPTPAPLTNGVVDDINDTFTGTLPNGYTAIDVEKTYDGGTTWSAITSLPITVPNANFAINKVGLRIKATSDRNASAVLYNAVVFTSSTGTNPDAGFTPVSTFTIDPDITQSTNNLTWTYNGTDANRFFTNETLKGNIGQQFEVRFDVDPTKTSARLGFARQGQGYKFALMYWERGSDTQGQFFSIIQGNYTSSGGKNLTVAPRGRVKADGVNITTDYSLDGGTTWVNLDSIPQVTDAAVRIAGEFVQFNSVTNGAIKNIIQKGLVTA